ncbi:MAG: c-type cytochrome domain-containing protein [Verrucomicrobiales bacterium]
MSAAAAMAPAAEISFNRDIRPLLSDRCFKCHGPDKKKAKGGLQLHTKSAAFAPLDDEGTVAILPGKPADSSLWQRIETDDPDDQMPPPDSGLELSAAEKALIKRWIEEGADFQAHWSFIPPARPALPEVSDRVGEDAGRPVRCSRSWMPRNEAVARRRSTLIRRMSPEPDRAAADPPRDRRILVGTADGACVQAGGPRLLKSPLWRTHGAAVARCRPLRGHQRIPIRPAAHPVALARLGDRRAFNNNLPYDQFATTTLMKRLLPDALAQKVATGFNRKPSVHHRRRRHRRGIPARTSPTAWSPWAPPSSD